MAQRRLALHRIALEVSADDGKPIPVIQRAWKLFFLFPIWRTVGFVGNAEAKLKIRALALFDELIQLMPQITGSESSVANAIKEASQNGPKRGIGPRYVSVWFQPEDIVPIPKQEWDKLKPILVDLINSATGTERRERFRKEGPTSAYALPEHYEQHARHWESEGKYDHNVKFRPPEKQDNKQKNTQGKGGNQQQQQPIVIVQPSSNQSDT